MSQAEEEADQAVEATQAPQAPSTEQQAQDSAFERKLYVRVIISVAIYVIFLILIIAATLMAKIPDYQIVLFVLLISAVALMPRQTLPTNYAKRPPAQIDRAFVLRMSKLRNWLAIVRFVFFILAVLGFMVLPELLGPPS